MRPATGSGVLAVARATPVVALASAAPILIDVDGDGTADRVELEASGELRIETRRGTSRVPLGIAGAPASVSAAVARGTPTVIVQTSSEGIIVQAVGATWKEVARTTIGDSGLDGDFAYTLDARPEGIYRYQTRAGFRRCDGQPAYLFAEGFTGTRFQRLAKLPAGVPDSAPVIAARLDPSPAPEALLYKARLASHQPGAMDAGALAIPRELDDNDPATLWREDLVASAGEGQFFTYVPRFAGAKATQIRIVPGALKGGNRPQRIGVVSATGAWRIELPDPQRDAPNSAYVADLPAPVEGCVTAILESTWGPDKGATSIAELAIYAEGERTGGGEAALARVISEGKDGARLAAQALARRGAGGVAALDAELARTTDPHAKRRLVRAAMEIRDPSAGPVLARAVREDLVDGTDRLAAIAALAGLGQGQTLHDLAATAKFPLDARVAAVAALRPQSQAERELLIALAGRGPRALRRAVIDALTQLPIDVLAPAAQGHARAPSSGDLWRAITRRAHGNPADRAPALTALTGALTAATDYERRYRIIDGIAAIGDRASLQALARLLAELPDSAETSAYKQIAARAIAVNARPEAVDLVVAFTTDRDPGVRLAGLGALAGAATTAGGPWHGPGGPDAIDRVIITVLATDRWPEVRRFAAQSLGARCSRVGPARALADSLARDKDLGVRGDAVAALVECKAPGTAELLARLWDDGAAPIELRQRAVDLTVTLAEPALAARLVRKFSQWRAGALESEAALALAQNAAFAIGRLAPPGAAEALLAALSDAAFPEIVAAAATGLGLLGPACPAAARPRLAALRDSDEQQIQLAASRAAAQCGAK